jgi:hypothetical protein
MERLEQKIRNTKPVFELPPSGHEKRFSEKLDKHFRSSPKIDWWITAYAASIALILGLALFYIDKTPTSDTSLILALENQEYLESEIYFQNLVASKIATLKSLDKNAKTHLSDIKEFDKSLANLKEDLKEAPGDERIVEAVLTTYMLKIEALDNIEKILKNIS